MEIEVFVQDRFNKKRDNGDYDILKIDEYLKVYDKPQPVSVSIYRNREKTSIVTLFIALYLNGLSGIKPKFDFVKECHNEWHDKTEMEIVNTYIKPFFNSNDYKHTFLNKRVILQKKCNKELIQLFEYTLVSMFEKNPYSPFSKTILSFCELFVWMKEIKPILLFKYFKIILTLY